MKKKYIPGVMVMAMLMLGSCGRQQSYIGSDQAKQLALEACSKTAEEADSVTADMFRNNDKDYYRIDIMAGGQHYQIEIDALAGAVTKVSVSDAVAGGQESGSTAGQTVPADAEQAASGQENSTEAGQSAAGQTNQSDGMEHHSDGDRGNRPTAQSTSDPATGSNAGSGTAAGIITLEDAKERALAHAGLTADQVTFVEDKLDHEDGRQVYELEFYTGDRKEYDYEIDAANGEIISFDYDAEHYTPSQSTGESITADDAKALALSKVPGASESDIREFEVDRDDGRMEYEGKIIYNGTEYEFEIDEYGQILGWEEEPVRGR